MKNDNMRDCSISTLYAIEKHNESDVYNIFKSLIHKYWEMDKIYNAYPDNLKECIKLSSFLKGDTVPEYILNFNLKDMLTLIYETVTSFDDSAKLTEVALMIIEGKTYRDIIRVAHVSAQSIKKVEFITTNRIANIFVQTYSLAS